jgi:hypothetical protein
MPDHETDSETKSSQEAKLIQYQETRQDLRQKADRNDRRFLRGVVTLGAILGYAFIAETQILVVIIPWVIGFLFVLGIQRWIDVDFLARQCLDIEREIEPNTFKWEHEYGRLLFENKRHIKKDLGLLSVRLDKFPFNIGYFMGGSTYIGFIAYSVTVVEPNMYKYGIIAFYLLFSVLLVLVWISERKTREKLVEGINPRDGK